MKKTAIQKACEIAGSQLALAKKIGVTPPAVFKMCKKGRVPSLRVLQIEKATGVSRHELRPDLYPRETDAH